MTKRQRKPKPARPGQTRQPVVPERSTGLTIGVIGGVGAIAYVFALCWLAWTGPVAAPVLIGGSTRCP